MATSSSALPKKINRFKLSTLSVLLIFVFCVFLFNRRALDSKDLISNTDRISETPVSLLLSPPRSAEFLQKLGDLREPVSSLSNVDDNVPESSGISEHESRERSKEDQISSESVVDGVTTREKEELVGSDLKSRVNLGQSNGEQSNGEKSKEEHNSSKPNFGGEATPENEMPLVSSDSESSDDSGERNGESVSSNEENVDPVTLEPDVDDKTIEKSDDSISSNSDIGEDTSGKTEDIGVEERLNEETPSSDSDNGGVIDNAVLEKLRNCDIYKGTWVKDDAYPLYIPGSCPYVDDGYDCQGNGRPDSEYTQWRWKPDECDLPRFNATDFLVRLRGKRLMLVGDSMNRNQFESLLCLLCEGLADKSRMYETHGYKISKGRGYFIFRFKDYDCSVEFVRSHFLVREGIRINGQGNSNPTSSIDRIDKTSARWLRADILVFNTGHWWTHGKTARGKNYYKEGNHIYPHFDAVEAYSRAITTWATWIKKNIRRNKLVIYRGYSSAHFRGGDWDSGGSCKGETEPVLQGAILDNYPEKMTIVEDVIRETQVRVVLLNVTRLTNFHKDGHPSIYGKNVTRLKKVSTRRQDCSHWCLPGVPDAWNELIYTTLVAKRT